MDGLKKYAKEQGKEWRDVNLLRIEQEEVNNLFYSLHALYLPDETKRRMEEIRKRGIKFSREKLPTGKRPLNLNFSQYELDEK